MRQLMIISVVVVLLHASAFAQTQPRTASVGSVMTVQVTDKSGNPVSGVAVAVTGPVERSAMTGQDGTTAFRSMRAGTYRLRFEHEGFVTLERELTTRAQPSDVSVALNAAPKSVKPVEPVAPPPPQPSARPNRNVEPRTISLVDWVEKNLIGSEPIKSSLLACADGGTATVLQVKDPMPEQTHADNDEMVYVIAGEGFVRIRNQDIKVGPGSFALVPRGVPHTMRRDRRNALIVLSVLAGAPCTDPSPPIK
jgi:mannose-6-phosphate isomerase-like protein (cupin superfamily)